MELRTADGSLSLERVAVMGVLNVTPDSFSDGGLWIDPERAVAHGLEMAEQGAAIIDVGGESTRPGAEPVPEDEELKRVLPVIQGLRAAGDSRISIDTRKPAVARRALEEGAAIINDTLGESTDRGMDAVAASMGAGICVMHSRGTPATMRSLTGYRDVVRDVASFLSRRAAELEDRGVAPDAIALDPGIGFAKSPAQNLEVLDRLDELADLGYPLLVGTSRKSFIGAVLDLPETDRLEGTIATVVWAIAKGAKIVRVHDIGQVMRAVRMSSAILDIGRSEMSDRLGDRERRQAGNPNQPGTPGTTGSDRLGDRERRQAGNPNQPGTPGTTGSDRLGDREEQQ